MSANHSTTSDITLQFHTFETLLIEPTPNYIEDSMSIRKVKDYLIKNKFKKNVYMICGIHHGIFDVVKGSTREIGYTASIGINVPQVGLVVGPVSKLRHPEEENASWEGMTDIVCAVKLREI